MGINLEDLSPAQRKMIVHENDPRVDRVRAMQPEPATPKKAHKYRAEPCIVTDDLTLFKAREISALYRDCLVLTDDAPLKTQAKQKGIDGKFFSSTREGERYIELKRLEQIGEIRGLELQKPYVLRVGSVVLGEWRADFDYHVRVDADIWQHRTEDTKGVRTELYRWKRAHVEAQYQIQIREL